MNCKKCGSLITEKEKFCPNCGEANESYVDENVNNQNLESESISPIIPGSEPAPAFVINPAPKTQETKKKSNTGFIILVIILLLIIAGLSIFIIHKLGWI